ncbi:hypothetical protein BC830DRAFT_94707 [Chytriomyces sp. MP71]|nr:hypothetical protein BC830DRAFT_94707 [Chytriomyces sp. MP71]
MRGHECGKVFRMQGLAAVRQHGVGRVANSRDVESGEVEGAVVCAKVPARHAVVVGDTDAVGHVEWVVSVGGDLESFALDEVDKEGLDIGHVVQGGCGVLRVDAGRGNEGGILDAVLAENRPPGGLVDGMIKVNEVVLIGGVAKEEGEDVDGGEDGAREAAKIVGLSRETSIGSVGCECHGSEGEQGEHVFEWYRCFECLKLIVISYSVKDAFIGVLAVPRDQACLCQWM